MGRKKKSKIEFRYYRMPEDIPPNLPKLLYIGFKLIPQIPYKIGV